MRMADIERAAGYKQTLEYLRHQYADLDKYDVRAIEMGRKESARGAVTLTRAENISASGSSADDIRIKGATMDAVMSAIKTQLADEIQKCEENLTELGVEVTPWRATAKVAA